MGTVPTISINKTEGCQVYLSKESLNCDIVSAKSSEMNIMIPQDDDYVSVLDGEGGKHYTVRLGGLRFLFGTSMGGDQNPIDVPTKKPELKLKNLLGWDSLFSIHHDLDNKESSQINSELNVFGCVLFSYFAALLTVILLVFYRKSSQSRSSSRLFGTAPNW